MTFKRRGEGERALCDKFDFYVCQNNHVWSYLCPGGSQPIIPWASDPRFGRTSDDSEIVAPLTLHLGRVDRGETYIQCLVLEAGLYQNYGREERKGRRKKNKMMNWDIKRRRRREGGGEAQSVMLLCTWKAPALHCVQIHFHKPPLSNIFRAIWIYLVPTMFGYHGWLGGTSGWEKLTTSCADISQGGCVSFEMLRISLNFNFWVEHLVLIICYIDHIL